MASPDPVLTRFGYEPALDGVRAVSVVAVMLYHGGFGWMHGGFLGVEVFFVVSGFLITTLLIEEHRRSGSISLRRFWHRRFRRLLPALFVVLAAVTAWAVVAGSAEQAAQTRRDLPWALLYVANWGQIVGETPYFAPGDPPLLRHLWSLAVEEQWYVVWPLVVAALGAAVARRHAGWVIGVAAVAVIGLTAWWSTGGPLISSPIGFLDGADRVNVLYLSTPTRSSGLLLGAAAAFLWRPWATGRPVSAARSRSLGVLGAAGVVVLAGCFVVVELTDPVTYRLWLPLTSAASLVVVLASVHPDVGRFRSVLSTGWLVAVGRRSYGWYLWSWPVAVVVGATTGDVVRFVVSTALALALAEISYRVVETPIRHGALGRWWRARRGRSLAVGLASVACVATLAVAVVRVEPFDRFVGDDQATFDLAAVQATLPPPAPSAATSSPLVAPTVSASGTVASNVESASDTDRDAIASTTVAAASPATSSTSTTSTTLPPPSTRARVSIVGDSTANALASNRPRGIEAVFPTLRNRSLDGCGVYDSGRVVSVRSFRNDFAICRGWQGTWERAAADTDVVLVVIGAWEVFDLTGVATNGSSTLDLTFASPAADAYFVDRLGEGVALMRAAGANVALLEVPCMRPIDSSGTPVPALPERGDDGRVAHLNELMRRVADAAGPRVWFVEGPDAWCDDEAVASDTALRWDGVHVYGRGANLIFETIASDLLQLAAIE